MKASEWRTLRATLTAIGAALADDPEARAEVTSAVTANLAARSTVPPAAIATVGGWIEDGARSLIRATVAGGGGN